MSASYWLAVAAYLLPTFPLGYLWHLVVFRAAYDRLEIFRPGVLIPLGVTSMAIQALIYAWLFPCLFSTASGDWMRSALDFGAVFGLLAWTLAVLPVAAKYRLASVRDFVLLETAFTISHYAVVSPLIALAWRGQV